MTLTKTVMRRAGILFLYPGKSGFLLVVAARQPDLPSIVTMNPAAQP
ncbi:MAG: hypothetical protein ABIN58_10120 [candidate division WOR-3 bacterium]